VNRESGTIIIISHGNKDRCPHEWANYSENPPDTRDKIHTPVNRGKKLKREVF